MRIGRRLWVVVAILLLASLFGFAGGYLTKILAQQRYELVEPEHPVAIYPTGVYFWAGAGSSAGW